MILKILDQNETREIEKSLNVEFGVEKVFGRLVAFGNEKLFLFVGDAGEKEITALAEIAPIERIGIYFAKVVAGEARLSIEGSQILGKQIKKNIFELDEEQMEKWMMGEELNVNSGMKGFVVMKYKDNFLGCGKASAEKQKVEEEELKVF